MMARSRKSLFRSGTRQRLLGWVSTRWFWRLQHDSDQREELLVSRAQAAARAAERREMAGLVAALLTEEEGAAAPVPLMFRVDNDLSQRS